MYYDRPKKHREQTEGSASRFATARPSGAKTRAPAPRPKPGARALFAKKQKRSRRGLAPDLPGRIRAKSPSGLRQRAGRRARKGEVAGLFRAKPRVSRRKSHFLLKSFLALLLLLALGLGALYALPVSSLGRQPAPGAALPLPGGYTHVLLIGADKDSGGTSRSDTMIIASVGERGVLLTSLQRDTGVSIPGRSGLHRLNAAYAYGGAELLLETINRNFGLDLSLYAQVDYEGFPLLIDALGGVDLEGVTDDEAEQINHNVYELLKRRLSDGSLSLDEARNEFLKRRLLTGGDLHLDGAQALGYARIRKTDSDYGRTARQRKLLRAAFAAVKRSGPIKLIRLANAALKCIDTNMNLLQLLSLGEKALLSSQVEQLRLPIGGSFTDSGGMFYNVDYDKNHDAFVSFVYGK